MTYYKTLRVVDETVLDEVRSLGYCELANFGQCAGPLDPHHIKSRGSGGGDTRDNIISVCRHHHQMAHNGLISRQIMRQIVLKRLESWTI